MRHLKGFVCKVLLALLAVFLIVPDVMTVHAEEVEAELITIEEEKDFAVMFTYEGEQPVVTFISPSGVEYAEGISSEAELLSAHGEGWSTYKVISAQAGTWRVRCDKKNNEYVNYSFVEEIDGLCIQSFQIISIEDAEAKLSFDVTMGDDEQIRYNYSITAIAGEDESAGKLLKKGSAYTGETCEVSVDMELSSYENYRFLLEVTANAGMEMFDSMLSEQFSYVNSNTPQAMEDFYAKIDMSNSYCELNWKDFSVGRNNEYHLLVFGDGDTENPVYTNETTNTEDGFYYPVECKTLNIKLYYKNKGVLSEPVIKEIDLINGEKLTIITGEITSGAQLELEYKTNEPALLEVRRNEESGQYNITGTGSVYFPLKEGENSIEASFVGGDNITYVVRRDVFRNTTPPVLVLYENLDGMTFKNGEAVLNGEVKNTEKLTVNDMEVAIGEEGTFTYTLALTEGVNNVTIVATSPLGVSTSRNMQILSVAGGLQGSNRKEYLPLLVSLGISIVIILYTLLFVRKKEKGTEKTRKPMTYKRLAISLGIWTALLDAISVAGYVYFYRLNHSRKYAEVVKESLSKAVRYMDYEQYFFKAMLIFSGILVINLLIGLGVKFIGKKMGK